MTTMAVARRTGLYRCSGIGQTVYVKAGEDLPVHATCEGGCEWEFRSTDNPRPDNVTVIVGSGPFYPLIISEVPRVGDTINLKHGLRGNYRVTEVGTIERPGYLWPHILVERVGDHEIGHPIHGIGYEVPL